MVGSVPMLTLRYFVNGSQMVLVQRGPGDEGESAALGTACPSGRAVAPCGGAAPRGLVSPLISRASIDFWWVPTSVLSRLASGTTSGTWTRWAFSQRSP